MALSPNAENWYKFRAEMVAGTTTTTPYPTPDGDVYNAVDAFSKNYGAQNVGEAYLLWHVEGVNLMTQLILETKGDPVAANRILDTRNNFSGWLGGIGWNGQVFPTIDPVTLTVAAGEVQLVGTSYVVVPVDL